MGLTFASAPATAGTVTLPDGCTAYVTIQQRQCMVTHHYRCTDDPDGHQWRVDITTDGPNYTAQIDRETQWIYSRDLLRGDEETLVPDPADPASLSDLLRHDLDAWDFETVDQNGARKRFVGFDQITGTTAIDGVNLLVTRSQIEATDETGLRLWGADGQQFLHPDWRIFMFGQEAYIEIDGSRTEYDHTPVQFIFPGEQGFLSDTPQYDCNTFMSRRDARPGAAQLMEVSQ
ncbi:MAG: hypothetical protein AAF701_05220 [Pseudomonadota bacterium]